MKIKYRIILITLAPLLFLTLFMASNVTQTLDNKRMYNQTVNVVEQSAVISRLIHEVQKERGMSAGYISSQGTNFSRELLAQHDKVNQALESFVTITDSIREIDEDIYAELSSNLRSLSDMRKSVLSLNTSVPILADYYTSNIDQMIDLVATDLYDLSDVKLSQYANSYLYVIKAKEKAGLERAMGATGFGQGNFTISVYKKFYSLIASQDILLSQASSILESEGYSIIQELIASQPKGNVQQYREIVHNSVYGGSLGVISSSEWFGVSTRWIDELKGVEDQLASLLAGQTEVSLSRANKNLMFAGLIGILSVLVSFGLAIFIAKKLSSEIKAILGVMLSVSKDKTDIKIPYRDRSDEIADIANMTEIFRTNVIKRQNMAAEAQKQQAETQKLKDAQEISEKEKQAREKEMELARSEEEEKQREVEENHRIEQERQSQERFEEQAKVVGLLAEGLKRLAQGQLGYQIETRLNGKFETLRQDFNQSSTTLHQTLSNISSSALGMDANLNDIAEAVNDLAMRTEQQASALGDTSDAVGEINTNVQTASKSTQEAGLIVNEVRDKTHENNQVVSEAVEAMSKIEESSQQISQIINVIDDIAFQTNLLALNAGVEAARAGEAGKGFAVVASEVRALAQRSSEAARDIRDLISMSSDQVQNGVELVRGAGVSLNALADQIGEVTSLFGNMRNATQEQSVRLGDVTQSVKELDTVTQQNTAMVEETNAAAQALRNEAHTLNGLIAQFDLKSGNSASSFEEASSTNVVGIETAA